MRSRLQSLALAVPIHATRLRPPQRQEWLALVDTTDRPDLHLIAREGELLLFRVEAAPPV